MTDDAKQAELYRHMLECAKANGFGSISEAIARAVKAEAKLIEQEQAHLAAIGQMVRERDKDMEETRAILERVEKVEAENARLVGAAARVLSGHVIDARKMTIDEKLDLFRRMAERDRLNPPELPRR